VTRKNKIKNHILFSHFEKEFSQLAKSNHKNKTLPRTGSVFQLVFLPDWLTTFEGVDQLYETGGCHVGAMFFFGSIL
jgi:hypothetical protein